MILHLNLTEDHLKLVRFFNIEDKDDDFDIEDIEETSEEEK